MLSQQVAGALANHACSFPAAYPLLSVLVRELLRQGSIVTAFILSFIRYHVPSIPSRSVQEADTMVKNEFAYLTIQYMLFLTAHFIIPNLEDKLDSGAPLLDVCAALLLSFSSKTGPLRASTRLYFLLRTDIS